MSTQAKYALLGVVFAVCAGLVAYIYLTESRAEALQSGGILLGAMAAAAAGVIRGGRCGWRCRGREAASEPDNA